MQFVADGVPEGKRLQFEAVGLQQRLMRNGAQRDNHFQARHCGQFVLQMPVTLANLTSCWLVGGRQAANGIADPAIAQSHCRIGPLIGAQWLGDTGKAESVQGRIKQFAGHVAGEWPSGPVGAALARPQAENKEFGIK